MRPLFLPDSAPADRFARVAQSPAEYASPLTRYDRRTGPGFWAVLLGIAIAFTLLALAGALPGAGQ